MKWAVTYESDEKAPETIRGETPTNDEDLAVRKAMNSIAKACPRYKWTSLCLTLEKPIKPGQKMPRISKKELSSGQSS